MEHRMCRSAPMGSISFWAWVGSVALHILLLAVLALVQFCPEKPLPTVRQRPAARIARIKEIVNSPFVIPKPKVKQPRSRLLSPVPAPDKSVMSITPPNAAASNLACLASKPGSVLSTLPHSQISTIQNEFFGSPIGARRICFVVDCSGSMHGMFRQVCERLKNAVMNLRPDQYFYIILFNRDRLIESSDRQLVRATGRAKRRACDFIDNVTPAGRTDALAALKRAMEIQDNRGRKPDVISFLTDGFELLPEDDRLLPEKIATMRKRLAPETKINTIGFWAQPADCVILRSIANESGGEFSYVEP
jgi:hypothetical protein